MFLSPGTSLGYCLSRSRLELASPANAHHDADQDGGGDDHAEQVLQDYRPGIRSGNYVFDQGVYPTYTQYYYWTGLYLHSCECPAYYSALVSGLRGTLSRPPSSKDLSNTFSASSIVIRFCSSAIILAVSWSQSLRGQGTTVPDFPRYRPCSGLLSSRVSPI